MLSRTGSVSFVVRVIAELKDIAKPVNLPLPAQAFEQPSVRAEGGACDGHGGRSSG